MGVLYFREQGLLKRLTIIWSNTILMVMWSNTILMVVNCAVLVCNAVLFMGCVLNGTEGPTKGPHVLTLRVLGQQGLSSPNDKH